MSDLLDIVDEDGEQTGKASGTVRRAMIALEDADLERVVEIEFNGGEYTVRLAMRGGALIPGLLRASPYRIVHYGFVCAEEMPGISQFGMPESHSFRLYEIRIVAAFVDALNLDWKWEPPDEPVMLPTSIPIPNIEEARGILTRARIPIHPL